MSYVRDPDAKDIRIMLIPSAIVTILAGFVTIWLFVDAIISNARGYGGSFGPTLLFFAVLIIAINFLYASLRIRKVLQLIYGEKILKISELCEKTRYSEKKIISMINMMLKEQYLVKMFYSEFTKELIIMSKDEMRRMSGSSYDSDIINTDLDEDDEDYEEEEEDTFSIGSSSDEVVETSTFKEKVHTVCPSCNASLEASKNGICGYCGTEHGIYNSDE
jgi:rubrerythrin